MSLSFVIVFNVLSTFFSFFLFFFMRAVSIVIRQESCLAVLSCCEVYTVEASFYACCYFTVDICDEMQLLF